MGNEKVSKLREEPCSIHATIDKLDREVTKKMFLFLSDELSKQEVSS